MQYKAAVSVGALSDLGQRPDPADIDELHAAQLQVQLRLEWRPHGDDAFHAVDVRDVDGAGEAEAMWRYGLPDDELLVRVHHLAFPPPRHRVPPAGAGGNAHEPDMPKTYANPNIRLLAAPLHGQRSILHPHYFRNSEAPRLRATRFAQVVRRLC